MRPAWKKSASWPAMTWRKTSSPASSSRGAPHRHLGRGHATRNGLQSGGARGRVQAGRPAHRRRPGLGFHHQALRAAGQNQHTRHPASAPLPRRNWPASRRHDLQHRRAQSPRGPPPSSSTPPMPPAAAPCVPVPPCATCWPQCCARAASCSPCPPWPKAAPSPARKSTAWI